MVNTIKFLIFLMSTIFRTFSQLAIVTNNGQNNF